MRAFRAPTLTDLNRKLCETIVHAPKERLDVISSVDIQIHNVVAEATSMEWTFDLKELWLTSSRWTMMVRQYIDPNDLRAWIEQCTGKIGTNGRGIAVLRTKVVKPRGGEASGGGGKETRRWGSCMLAVSYKAKPRPQITLYSRTSYLGYLAGLDLSVAWMCGRYLAHAMGVPIESFSFVWLNEAMQYHNFKSMAFLLNNPDPEKADMYRRMLVRPADELTNSEKRQIIASPGLSMTRKWMKNILKLDEQAKTYGDMTYNTYVRVRRRFHTEVLGHEYAKQFEGWRYYRKGPKIGQEWDYYKAYPPLPSISIHSLDFSKIGLPLDGHYAVDYDESDEGDYDDDDL